MSDGERCLIRAVAVGQGHYKWSWSTSCGRSSRHYFRYFYDCVADANANGYSVNLPTVVEQLRGAEQDRPSAPGYTNPFP
jgi:hypothetical protein